MVGIRKDRLINLMNEKFGIVDKILMNQIYNKMFTERKTIGQFLIPIIKNYFTNEPELHGECRNGECFYDI